jgi:cobalt/nickel transport system permease protein
MDITFIDRLSIKGDSFFHRVSPLVKVINTLGLVIMVGICNQPSKLVILLSVIILFLLLSRFPLLKLLHVFAYPMVFGLIFAISSTSASAVYGVTVVLKAVVATGSILLLVSTTSYTEIFSWMALLLPDIVIDSLFLTYRSFFMLVAKAVNLFTAIRLRGGYNPLKILFNIKNTAKMVGVMVIHSMDMSERIYNIFLLRGYNGKVLYPRSRLSFKKQDGIILPILAVLFWMVIGW